MYPAPSHSQKKVKVLSKGKPEFERVYLKALQRSNRMVSDAELQELPHTFFYTMHKPAWEKRAYISEKLIQYLSKKKEPFKAIDLGCGNGWLAARMAEIQQSTIAAVDINLIELEQAARVFQHKNLELYYGDIFKNILSKGEWDYIILFDTISYFPNLVKLINRCREYLTAEGEIHILESPFYQEREIEKAQKETEAFYKELRSEEMMEFHHFHSKQDIQDFDYTYLYQPSRLKSIFNKKASNYPWIRITN
ncbi:MAG: methyltransferase domain-containing protein [Bacteroidota bacterium]